ncbi:MAG: hypothetical protein KatS3mg031_2180 [Chitinophagales bacterium]|nr:MAG: hypothetical protein KatS3mg031_2180 [Chitinophagales bacterium]
MHHLTIILMLSSALFVSCNSGSTNKSHSAGTENALNVTPDQLSAKVDPVCRMSMDQHPIADTMTYKGKLYGFCSPGCKEAFKAEPESFLSQAE